MSSSLAHHGLPEGIKPWQLADLVKQVGRVPDTAARISRTAVAVLEYCIAACREGDFQAGRICGIWEQPSSLAAKLGISTKVLHNAEAELRAKGWIARTSNPHARRRGERRGGAIVALEGISLAPLIDRYDEIVQIIDARALQQHAVADLRAEVAQVRRQIRELNDTGIIEQAEAILPRGRTSRINQIGRLESIKADLEALLVLVDRPSGDTKSSHQSEEIVTPNIPEKDSSQNCSGASEPKRRQDEQPAITPKRVAGLASENYQETLTALGGPSWPNIVEASALACNWLGIAQPIWGQACQAMGRERAALCVLVIDRNRRLPEGHRYHRKHSAGSLEGMIRKGSENLNLFGLLRAMEGYPGGAGRSGEPLSKPAAHPPKGVHTVGEVAAELLAKFSENASGAGR